MNKIIIKAKQFVQFYVEYSEEKEIANFRIDTQEKNLVVRKMYSKLGS